MLEATLVRSTGADGKPRYRLCDGHITKKEEVPVDMGCRCAFDKVAAITVSRMLDKKEPMMLHELVLTEILPDPPNFGKKDEKKENNASQQTKQPKQKKHNKEQKPQAEAPKTESAQSTAEQGAK